MFALLLIYNLTDKLQFLYQFKIEQFTMRLGTQFLARLCRLPKQELLIRTASAVHYANIVQRVKMCYKIKINSRESKSCFYGVLLSKQHPCLTIAPLLQSNSGTIRV